MLNDADLLKRYQQDMEDCEPRMKAQHKAAAEAHMFYAGDTMFYTASVEDKGDFLPLCRAGRLQEPRTLTPVLGAVNGTGHNAVGGSSGCCAGRSGR